MPAHRAVGLIVFVVILGLIVGSLLGELLGAMFHEGWVQGVLTRGPTIGLTKPATLDFHFLSVTFGFTVKVNVVGLAGVVIAVVTLRKL